MNRSANEFECGTLGFDFIQLCSTRVSNIVVFSRKKLNEKESHSSQDKPITINFTLFKWGGG